MSANKNNSFGLGMLIQKFTPLKKRRFLGWRIAYLVTVGSILASGLIVSFFIYQNTFATLTNAYNIMILSSELGADTVDMAAFEHAENTINNIGRTSEIPGDLRNLFEYNIVSPTSTVSTTIKTP